MKVFVLLELLLMVAFLVLLERKVLGLLQLRKGPNIVGFYSVVQTILDGLKLIMKEMLYTKNKRVSLFFFSPVFALFVAMVIWEFVPSVLVSSGSSGVLLVLLLSSMMVFFLISASWGSNNVYALVGGVRATAQMVSYEVVLFLFVGIMIFPVMFLDWESFIQNQLVGYGFFWMASFVFFVLWVVIILAELNRTPFDLVEGESELVSGFNVEYASFGFTLFFLAEYMNIWFMSTLTVLLFTSAFGGLFMVSVLVVLVTFLVLFLRGLLPRFKFYDLIFLTWGVLLPLVLMFLSFVGIFLMLSF